MWNENMELTTRTLPAQKHIALVAHDHCKDMLMKWVARHQAQLAQHILYATGTTGNLVSRATGLEVNAMLSGPMGGDWIIKSAGGCPHFRRQNRRADLLLGSAERRSPRPGCQSVAAPGHRLEHSGRH